MTTLILRDIIDEMMIAEVNNTFYNNNVRTWLPLFTGDNMNAFIAEANAKPVNVKVYVDCISILAWFYTNHFKTENGFTDAPPPAPLSSPLSSPPSIIEYKITPMILYELWLLNPRFNVRHVFSDFVHAILHINFQPLQCLFLTERKYLPPTTSAFTQDILVEGVKKYMTTECRYLKRRHD